MQRKGIRFMVAYNNILDHRDRENQSPHVLGRGISTLVNRNIFLGDRRTSLRLEPAMWDALSEICRREGMSPHELCHLIDRRRQASSLTAAIRVFIMAYFKSAATEEGHARIGHGKLYDSAREMIPGRRPGRRARRLLSPLQA